MSPLLVVITGPTAVGKTELCVQIAQHFHTEILSADSRQLYRELNIGTAKPTLEEMQGIKHHFIGSHSIIEEYNANDFEKDALLLLDTLYQKHNIVILTGGSGLYIDAICDGFDDELPGNDEKIRSELESLYEKYGIDLLQKKLKQLDPEFYQIIDLQNVKRLYRAIEVCLITGKPYSEIRKGIKQKRPFNMIKIGLTRDRDELFDRINNRVDQMMEKGLLKEVKDQLPFKEKNALQTVGYSELFDHLAGKITLDEAIENIKVNTRRYAKRQLNWFTKTNDYEWFHPNSKEEIINYICLKLNEYI